MEQTWMIGKMEINSFFSLDTLNTILNDPSKTFTITKSATLYDEGDISNGVYFIKEGRIKIFTKNEQSKEITKAILDPGQIFGFLSMADESTRSNSAQAMEKSVVCKLTKPEFQSILKDQNQMTSLTMKIMGQKTMVMEEQLEALVFKDSRSRIIQFLLELAQTKGQRVGYEYVVRKFVTHLDIAQMTATSRQTVTTVLNELRDKNFLTFDRRRLLIRDLEKLEGEVQ